ncbi:MAG TPA: type II secretion system F family protein [Bryobacteraceae bacterium]|nr:type II secretion system F family protein [Bryobacteraceae bacterium]
MPPLLALLFFLLLFTALAAMVWSGLQLLQPPENPLDDRLGELMATRRQNESRGTRRRFGGGFLNSFLYFLSLAPGVDSVLEESEQLLRQGGFRSREALAWFAMFNLAFFLSLIAGSWLIQEDVKPWFSKLLGLAPAFLLGWLLPKQVLYRLMKRYKNKLQEALPDTVDLLGIVLGTGLALDQAMSRVCEEMQFIYPELSAEFYTVVMQVKAGQDRGKAFQQLVRRTGIEDIKSLAAMIIQSERFGTSLSQALKVYADALRMRRRLRGEKAVGEAGIKMVLATVVFILPVVFIITLVPAMLTMLTNLRGGIGAGAR